MKELETHWLTLVSKYNKDEARTQQFWVEIEKEYSNKKRHYHNLNHLAYMCDKAFEYKDKLVDSDTVMFTIFYHDIVYNPKRQDNEQKSADVAHSRLTTLGISRDRIIACQEQILATKHHSSESDTDTKYLLDFDLAILGDSPGAYQAYCKSIRKEYSIYPDFLYKPGRKKVLQHFLQMQAIFKTEEFQNRYELQARKNMEEELLMLN